MGNKIAKTDYQYVPSTDGTSQSDSVVRGYLAATCSHCSRLWPQILQAIRQHPQRKFEILWYDDIVPGYAQFNATAGSRGANVSTREVKLQLPSNVEYRKMTKEEIAQIHGQVPRIFMVHRKTGKVLSEFPYDDNTTVSQYLRKH